MEGVDVYFCFRIPEAQQPQVLMFLIWSLCRQGCLWRLLFVRRISCQDLLFPSSRIHPSFLLWGSLGEISRFCPSLWGGSIIVVAGSLSSEVCHQTSVDFSQCLYLSCMFEKQEKKCLQMMDHAMLCHLLWYVRGDVTWHQCQLTSHQLCSAGCPCGGSLMNG